MAGTTLFQLSYALLWILALVLVPVCVVLLYLLARLQATPRYAFPAGAQLIGKKMPVFSAKDPRTGAPREVEAFRGQIHAILALSPDCGSCLRLMNELKSHPIGDLTQARILLLCMGSLERCQAPIADIHSVPVLVLDVMDDKTEQLWLTGLPAVLIVNEAGVIVDVKHASTLHGVLTAIEDAVKSANPSSEHDRVADPRSAVIG
jgi:hypothetical protein